MSGLSENVGAILSFELLDSYFGDNGEDKISRY